MTDVISLSVNKTKASVARLKSRHAAERRFRIYGIAAIVFGLSCIATLFVTIASGGYSTFSQTMVNLELSLDEDLIDLENIQNSDFRKIVRSSVYGMFPDVSGRREKRKLANIVSLGAEYQLREYVIDNPALIGKTIMLQVPMSDDLDQLSKGVIRADLPESDRRVSDLEIFWFTQLEK